MDDKEKFISVTHNNSDTEEKTEGTPPENDTQENQIPQEESQQNTPPQETVQYDDFMYQPIGFEQYDKENEALAKEAAEKIEKKRKARADRIMIALLLLIFIVTIGLCVFAIIKDVSDSGKTFGKDYTPPQNVVIYQQSKPENANDSDSYKDENGRYTTEGIAATVRPSIVEIFTYDDSGHNTLSGTGSGVIISEDGYIVTNTHVLKSDGYHVVKTYDDKSYDAKIIGRDAKTDIAIIKITASDLQPAVFGDSEYF